MKPKTFAEALALVQGDESDDFICQLEDAVGDKVDEISTGFIDSWFQNTYGMEVTDDQRQQVRDSFQFVIRLATAPADFPDPRSG